MGKLFTPQNLNSGFNSNASLTANFDNIESAFDKTLSRTGESPNQMETDIDMNSNSLLNVSGIDATSVVVDGVDIGQAAQDAQDAADSAATSASSAASSAVTATEAANSIPAVDIITETSDFTIDSTYNYHIIYVDSATNVTATLSDAASDKTQCIVIQEGDGLVDFQVQGSDTLLSYSGFDQTEGVGAAVTLIKNTDGWFIGGRLKTNDPLPGWTLTLDGIDEDIVLTDESSDWDGSVAPNLTATFTTGTSDFANSGADISYQDLIAFINDSMIPEVENTESLAEDDTFGLRTQDGLFDVKYKKFSKWYDDTDFDANYQIQSYMYDDLITLLDNVDPGVSEVYITYNARTLECSQVSVWNYGQVGDLMGFIDISASGFKSPYNTRAILGTLYLVATRN